MSSLLIVGSTALDTIHTPKASHERLLGGSANHAALAAALWTTVRLVGIVGTDFPKRYIRLLEGKGIDLSGLQVAEGPTFFWEGEYEQDMNRRRTLRTELGVFEHFEPRLPESYQQTPYVFLANIAPSLQRHVLRQMKGRKFVAADTMDLWLRTAREELRRLLREIDLLILNDSEARDLAGEENLFRAARKIRRMGPEFVIVKKGEHGSFLMGPEGIFLCPAYPVERVVDPTGAGDSFAGGLMGYLAQVGGQPARVLRRAMLYGAAVAAFCCEGFGVRRTARLDRAEVEERVKELRSMVRV